MKSCEFKMWLANSFFTIFITFAIAKNFEVQENSRLKVVDFVEDLLIDLNSKSNDTRDVIIVKCALFKSSKKQIDNLYEKIADIIPYENPLTIINYNTLNATSEKRKAAMVIVINDEYNDVSFVFLSFKISLH